MDRGLVEVSMVSGEPVFEVNFDGLVGPTHHYGGLSQGNIASTSHRAQVSNPREAALQGLLKMKYLADLGLKQGFLPPHLRPNWSFLRRIGFSGDGPALLEAAWRQDPQIVSVAYSSSYMWTANAATIAPSSDTVDHKVHFVPANLVSKVHRSIESEQTALCLKQIFDNETYFVHHGSLPSTDYFGDEGAANHSRLCTGHSSPAVHLFVYGRSSAGAESESRPKKYPARQSKEASEAVARLLGLDLKRVVLAQQSPEAIDAGAFHNDVVCVANEDLLFCHEKAFLNKDQVYQELTSKLPIQLLEVPSAAVSLEDAVKTYLFNSQILTLPAGERLFIAPSECETSKPVMSYLKSAPFDQIRFFDLRQSMQNGGGPACLRLRMVLTAQELASCRQSVLLTQATFEFLQGWVRKHYRDRLAIDDLRDPHLALEAASAHEDLMNYLGFGKAIDFS